MSNLSTALIVGLVSIIVVFDSRLFGRENVEQPLIGATIVGFLLGDPATGLAAGATIQLMAMGVVKVGAASVINFDVGTVVATALAIQTGAGIETILVLIVPVAVLCQLLMIVILTANSSLMRLMERAIAAENFKRVRLVHILIGPALFAIAYFIPTFAAIFFGTDFVQMIVDFIPSWLSTGLRFSGHLLTAFGMALLLSLMMRRGVRSFYFLGFLLAAYLNLSVTAIALFSVVLAVILAGLKFKGGLGLASQTTGVGGTTGSMPIDDDYDPLEDDED